MNNEYGVPYHGYTLTLKDGREIVMDIGEEEDWGNVQRCFTDGDGKTHRACVGWGGADEWTEVVEVFDLETLTNLDPLDWAEECVWPFANAYSD